jgi:hypothetical protein
MLLNLILPSNPWVTILLSHPFAIRHFQLKILFTGGFYLIKQVQLIIHCLVVCFCHIEKEVDAMADYLTHKFKNHPSISSADVEFLASNSGIEQAVVI